MDLAVTSQKSYGSTRVAVGARMSAARVDLGFAISAVCEEVAPESWRGEVRFGDALLITGPTSSDPYVAQRAAEAALKSRVAALFSDKEPPTANSAPVTAETRSIGDGGVGRDTLHGC